MNTEDKIHAEKVLKNLFIGSQVDGLQFGISPGAIKIHFTNFHDSVDYDGQLYINIEYIYLVFMYVDIWGKCNRFQNLRKIGFLNRL